MKYTSNASQIKRITEKNQCSHCRYLCIPYKNIFFHTYFSSSLYQFLTSYKCFYFCAIRVMVLTLITKDAITIISIHSYSSPWVLGLLHCFCRILVEENIFPVLYFHTKYWLTDSQHKKPWSPAEPLEQNTWVQLRTCGAKTDFSFSCPAPLTNGPASGVSYFQHWSPSGSTDHYSQQFPLN